ncbi:hypothetical protein WV31_01095 [Magnetospirillum sp. ME-1]|uniref:hypothetical protein n=1 Tax=Magnetospirillum sp. ME-1 TaxID=1639348 RepID=UPI000A17B156|nr:hypothetical protein [Magnetospirillum sp. ME-1]ARJ64386.1 hypothetical protein WV31_01095 [Magnetospirillum sp. ME-1]
MSILKTLALSNVEAPKNTRNTVSTIDRARGKFVVNLNHQIAAVDAHIQGTTHYTIGKKTYVKDESGQRNRLSKEIDVRPWWFEQNGEFFVTIRYANKPLELAKGKPSIAAGKSLEAVRTVLNQVREAVIAGELDKVLEAAATEARKRMTVK